MFISVLPTQKFNRNEVFFKGKKKKTKYSDVEHGSINTHIPEKEKKGNDRTIYDRLPDSPNCPLQNVYHVQQHQFL